MIEAPFHLIPFHAVKLKCDTDSGNPKKYDFTITISKDRAADILKRREQLNTSKNFVKRSYRPKNIYVFVLSALLSNSFAGVIFAAAFISNTGKLLGEQFESRLVGTFAQYAKLFAFGLPPAAAAVGYLLLFGWLIAFSRNLIRHKNLVVTRNHTSLYIKSGIFTKRKFSLLTKHINYIDIRQSISTKLLGLSSVFVNCTGYGKEKNESSVLMPPIGKRELADNLSVLFPEVHYKKPTMRPNFFSIFKFIADPAWYLLGVTAGMIVTTYLFASWKNLIFWIGGMAIVPGIWFLILRIVDFATTGIAANERGFTLKYSKGFTLHTVYIPVEKVTQVLLRQSIILQRGHAEAPRQKPAFRQGGGHLFARQSGFQSQAGAGKRHFPDWRFKIARLFAGETFTPSRFPLSCNLQKSRRYSYGEVIGSSQHRKRSGAAASRSRHRHA